MAYTYNTAANDVRGVAIHGLDLSYTAATVTYGPGMVDGVRVDEGTEAFTLAGASEFRKSLLVVNLTTGVVSEVAGTDTTDQTAGSAVAPDPAAGTAVLAVVELDATAITGIDMSAAGTLPPVSA